MKKVSFSGKPTAKAAPRSPDEWVSADSNPSPEPTEPPEKTKRLTIDIPLSLHQQLKSQCALQGKNMADVVRKLLEKHFPPHGQGGSAGGELANK